MFFLDLLLNIDRKNGENIQRDNSFGNLELYKQLYYFLTIKFKIETHDKK